MKEVCGCYIEYGKLVTECAYHKRREKLKIQRTVLYLESRVLKLFSETYLKDMQEKVINEIKKVTNE